MNQDRADSEANRLASIDTYVSQIKCWIIYIASSQSAQMPIRHSKTKSKSKLNENGK